MFIDKHENRKTTIKTFFLLSVKELFIASAYHAKVTGFQASCGEYFNFFLIMLRDEYQAVLTSCNSRAQMYESSDLLSPFKLLKRAIIIISWLRLFAVFCRVEFARETNVIICLIYFVVWVLTIYTSTLFSLHFLCYRQGEFVWQSRAYLIGDHFPLFFNLCFWFKGDLLGEIWSQASFS